MAGIAEAWYTIVMLIVTSGARRDLHEHCAGLGHEMSSHGPALYTDAREALRVAVASFGSLPSVGVSARWNLAKALEVVATEDRCKAYSGEYVSTIEACGAREWRELGAFVEATERYTARCLAASYWDGALNKALTSYSSSGKLVDTLGDLLSEQFIDSYKRESSHDHDHDDHEHPLHFGPMNSAGQSCCRPEFAPQAMRQALGRLMNLAGDVSLTPNLVQENSDRLESLIVKHLFKPCASYRSIVQVLMQQAQDASNYFKAGPEAFITSLSRHFQTAIFRYKFCLSFEHMTSKQTTAAILTELGRDVQQAA